MHLIIGVSTDFFVGYHRWKREGKYSKSSGYSRKHGEDAFLTGVDFGT